MKENSLLSLTKKKVAIITNNLHCERHVQYFSTIEKYFKENGWTIAEDFNVNKIVICGCGFHDAMFEKVKRTLEKIRKTNFLEKNIIIMACLPKTQEQGLKENFNGHIVELHREELLDHIIGAKTPFKEMRPVNVFTINKKCAPHEKENKKFHIKISEGCLRECTFCVINKAKGKIKSVPFDKIAAQVEMAIQCGRKEILLMGEDTFAYGIDIGSNIIELVEKLISLYPEIELYFGYLHIRWLKRYAKEILSLCKKGVFKELHIGLQHVNDEMLKKMGRPESFPEIYDIICSIKREIPGFYLVADILVGFPGETKEMFKQLMEFFEKDRCFDKVKHFGYSDVKGAPSTQFENKLSMDEIASRWDQLDKVLGERAYSHQTNESRIDNETFRVTRFEDYSFCKDTFEDISNEMTEEICVPQDLQIAKSNIIQKDSGDFEF